MNLPVNAIEAINQSHFPEKIYKPTILVDHQPEVIKVKYGN